MPDKQKKLACDLDPIDDKKSLVICEDNEAF
jgi:hypothetical protein